MVLLGISLGEASTVDASYSQDSALLLGRNQLPSSRGVQQGDPVGPAIFALAIQEDILEAKARTDEEYPNELDFVAFFLDDGTAAGTGQAVRHFLDTLLARLQAKGMEANVGKCVAVPSALDNTEIQEADFPGMKFARHGNFKLLGAPIGDKEFCTMTVRKRIDKARKLLQAASKMSRKQASVLITRSCGSFCKLA